VLWNEVGHSVSSSVSGTFSGNSKGYLKFGSGKIDRIENKINYSFLVNNPRL
jgi:hypothetical protein